jgi:hypothetical protein
MSSDHDRLHDVCRHRHKSPSTAIRRSSGAISFAPCASATTSGADIHEAFLSLGSALICWQSLRKGWLTGLRAWPVRPFAGLGATTRISLD